MNDCPCEALSDVWTCAVHDWGVAPWTATGKPDLTSGGLGLAGKSGGVPYARPVHAAVDHWVGRWTAMQKPDLPSCGRGHDASGNDLEEWRCVHGACGWQACGGACAEEQEKSACATSSPCDVVCDAAHWLTWMRRWRRMRRWCVSSFCAHQVHCWKRLQKEWQAERGLAAASALLVAWLSWREHTVPYTVLCAHRAASFARARQTRPERALEFATATHQVTKLRHVECTVTYHGQHCHSARTCIPRCLKPA